MMFLPDREPGSLSQQQFCGFSEVHLPILKGYLGSTLLKDLKAHFETTYIFMHTEKMAVFIVLSEYLEEKTHHLTERKD